MFTKASLVVSIMAYKHWFSFFQEYDYIYVTVLHSTVSYSLKTGWVSIFFASISIHHWNIFLRITNRASFSDSALIHHPLTKQVIYDNHHLKFLSSAKISGMLNGCTNFPFLGSIVYTLAGFKWLPIYFLTFFSDVFLDIKISFFHQYIFQPLVALQQFFYY